MVPKRIIREMERQLDKELALALRELLPTMILLKRLDEQRQRLITKAQAPRTGLARRQLRPRKVSSHTRSTLLALPFVAMVLMAGRTDAQTPCIGACSGNGVVDISDLVVGVNIVLGVVPASDCPAFENAQGQVDIAQLIRGVNNALTDCGTHPPRTDATPTETPTPQFIPPTADPCGACPGGTLCVDDNGVYLCTVGLDVQVSGKWSGSWQSDNGINSGQITFSLSQSGSTVKGHPSFSGSPCFSGGALSGTVSGGELTGSLTAAGVRVDLDAFVSETNAQLVGNEMDGTYDVVNAGQCTGDTGTFSAIKMN